MEALRTCKYPVPVKIARAKRDGHQSLHLIQWLMEDMAQIPTNIGTKTAIATNTIGERVD